MENSDNPSITALPLDPVKDRRRLSHSGVLDSAIRLVAQLTSSNDLNTRTIASRALAELQKLRHEMPKRRQADGKSLRR